jgi:hypothetical protein
MPPRRRAKHVEQIRPGLIAFAPEPRNARPLAHAAPSEAIALVQETAASPWRPEASGEPQSDAAAPFTTRREQSRGSHRVRTQAQSANDAACYSIKVRLFEAPPSRAGSPSEACRCKNDCSRDRPPPPGQPCRELLHGIDARRSAAIGLARHRWPALGPAHPSTPPITRPRRAARRGRASAPEIANGMARLSLQRNETLPLSLDVTPGTLPPLPRRCRGAAAAAGAARHPAAASALRLSRRCRRCRRCRRGQASCGRFGVAAAAGAATRSALPPLRTLSALPPLQLARRDS